MTDIITALYHAASSEEPDTMDGPSLCDYYQRREETEQTRRALVDAVGDEVDVDSYGVAMECQGFVNGFKLALGLCMGGVLLWIACWSCLRLAPTATLICAWTANRRPPPRCSPSWGITRSWRSWSTPTPTRRNRRGSSTAGLGHRLQRGSAWPFGNCLCW